MASSYPNNTHDDNDENYDPSEEDEEWLELGLGLSVARPKPEFRANSGCASASGSGFATRSRLGLGLGFDNEGVGSCSSNHHGLWQHYYQHLSSLPSSPSSWTWPMDLGGFLHRQNLLLPVSMTHDYCRRPETGLWFSLRSFYSREEEALPQIPKAYIRVKDEDVTVFMVKKYLVGKLGLANETEIDISCMGQKLLHSHTLKYVRDVVWLPMLIDSLNGMASMDSSDDSAMNHLMPLHYGRHCFWD